MRISLEGSTKSERLLAPTARIQTPLDLVLSQNKTSRVAYHSARVVLTSIGVLLVVEALIRLLLPTAHGYGGHLTEDVASFEFGVGLGAVTAGIRPSFAWMMRFILTPSALLLLITAIIGIMRGQTTVLIELQHLPVVLGAISANSIVILSRPKRHQAHSFTILKSRSSRANSASLRTSSNATSDPAVSKTRSFTPWLALLIQGIKSNPDRIGDLAMREKLVGEVC